MILRPLTAVLGRVRSVAVALALSIGMFALVIAGLGGIGDLGIRAGQESRPAPEFPSLDARDWAGTPTSLASLRGRVVVLNVWTFGCINCKRTLPWVVSIHERFGPKGVAVLGVHTPELEFERDHRGVEEARKKHGLDYPSFIDGSHAYWRALENQYWPATYLVDRKGTIRRVQIGEVHAGDEAAVRLEKEIEALLAEPGPPGADAAPAK